MRAKYATVKIPQDLATKLDEFVSDMGYRSRAEIVNDAIRRFIDERKRLDYPSTVKESEGLARDLKRNEIPRLTFVPR
jgi:metal-responsive CopG/Arc/MetJ family transcriptional regulator